MRSEHAVSCLIGLGILTLVGSALGQNVGAPAGDPYATRKIFYEQLWQSKIESALKYVDGAVVGVNVELSPQVSRTVAERRFDSRPIKEVESSHVAELSTIQPQANGPEKSTTTTDATYSKNLVSQSETTMQYAGLTPTTVSVSVSVPLSYLATVLENRSMEARQPDRKGAGRNQELATTEQEVSAKIVETVVALLPPSSGDRSRVRVSTFDDRQRETTALIRPNPEIAKSAWQTPEIITLVFDSTAASDIPNFGRLTSPSQSDSATFRVAAHVTDVRANGNLQIEGRRTIKDGEYQVHQTITGRIRPESVDPVAATVNGDEIADLRIDNLVLPAIKTTSADLESFSLERKQHTRQADK